MIVLVRGANAETWQEKSHLWPVLTRSQPVLTESVS